MEKGFVNLGAVIDLASRRVLAHKTAQRLKPITSPRSLSKRLRSSARRTSSTPIGTVSSLTLHSPISCLNGSCGFSRDGRGPWRDKVCAERPHQSGKHERVYFRVYDSISQARAHIAECFAWCNTKRQHTSIEDQTLNQAYWRLLFAIRGAR